MTAEQCPAWLYNTDGRAYIQHKDVGYIGQSKYDQLRIKDMRKRWAKPTFILRSFKGYVVIYKKIPA